MSIVYKKPILKDIDSMQKLVKPEVEDGIILYRSDDEIAQNIRSYIAAFDKDRVIGFCALHIYTKTLAEIRSLIIDKEYRGRGIGKKLVEFLTKESRDLGIKTLFALTYEKEFFKKIGFLEIKKEQLPEQKIWVDCIKCKYFPVCNEIAFIKKI